MWRWLPLWRLPLRVRLARLRRVRLRRMRLLPYMGTLRRLLKATLANPERNKSPSQHRETGRGPTVLAVPVEKGQILFVPMLSASQ